MPVKMHEVALAASAPINFFTGPPFDTLHAPRFIHSRSRETLEETVARTAKFLHGVGTRPAIRAALDNRGYDANESPRGWSLLHAASGYSPPGVAPIVDADVSDALRQVDVWDHQTSRCGA